MITIINKIRSGLRPPEGIRSVFSQYRTELEWLAYFLTGDAEVAAACVVDACALAVSHNPGFEHWLLEWARRATIRTAIQVQQQRITQLRGVYECRTCTHRSHLPLCPDLLETIVEETSALLTKLDVLCRCALVMHGVEGYSLHQTASLLRVDSTTVKAAYCAALQCLDVMRCEQFKQQNKFAAVCN